MKQFRIMISVFLLFASVTFAPAAEPANALVGWVGANKLQYDPVSGLNARVSYTNGYSIETSMAIDTNGYPHLVWSDRSTGVDQTYYVRWQGTQWVVADGTAFTGNNANVSNSGYNSSDPVLVLDSSNNPHIAWSDHIGANDEIVYVKWNGTNWVNISGSVYNGLNASVSNNNGGSYFANLVLDKNGYPCLAWSDNTPGNGEIFYVHWSGSSWITANGSAYDGQNGNITQNTSSSLICSLKLDSNDNPSIAWEDRFSGTFDVYYIHYNNILGQWQNALGQTYPANPCLVSQADGRDSGLPCLMFDNSGYPCISWQDNNTPSGNSNIFFVRWNGSSWVNANGQIFPTNSANVSNSNSGSGSSSLYIFNNNPVLAWHDYSSGNSEIFLVKWSGASWVNYSGDAYAGNNANVSNDNGLSYAPIVILNNLGSPMLAWEDDTVGNSEVYFVQFANSFDGTFDISKSVDTDGDSDFTDSGTTVDAGSTLDYRINWQFNPGQDPLEDPYLYDTIPDGTTYVAGSASPTANIEYSLDGGLTWTAGEPPDGSPAGTMLRWDLSSLWVGAAGLPYIGSAATQPMDINVSRNVGTDNSYVGGVQVKVDNLGNQHICWSDNTFGNGDIFYIKWNPVISNWVCADGAVYLPGTNGKQNVSRNNGQSGQPRLVLDKNNNATITWMDDSYAGMSWEILCVRWDSFENDWVCANGNLYVPLANTGENVSRNNHQSRNPQVELDSIGNPNIAWNDGHNSSSENDVYFVKWDTSKNDWVGVDGSNYVPDSNGSHIVTNTTIDNDFESLAVDINNNPHLTWNNVMGSPRNNISYVRYQPGVGWVCADGSLYTPANNSQFINTLNENSYYSCVTTDKNGFPHIAWCQSKTSGWGLSPTFDINYIEWDGNNSKWVNVDGSDYIPSNFADVCNVSNNSDASLHPILRLDPSGLPNIVWEDFSYSAGDVFYVRWNEALGRWVTVNGSTYNGAINGFANVSNNASVDKYPFLDIDSIGEPNIIWMDRRLPQMEAMFVHRASDSLPFMFSVQVDSPPTTLAFCNTATFRHRWDSGKALESNEVCNTIDYDFTGTFTLEKGVDANSDGKYIDNGATVNPGTNLGYRIDWTFTNPNNDPLFSAYVNDQIPPGTKYIAGSATQDGLSHSLDGGVTWIAGEPPDGALPGTRLRWGSLTTGWVGAANSRYNGANVLQPYDINVTKGQMGSSYPTVAVDSHNRPHMVWLGYNTSTWQPDIFYGKWDGTQWVNAAGLSLTYANSNITNDNLWEYNVTLVLDENDMPNIAWDTENGSSRKIAFTKWDGTQWVNADGTPYSYAGSSVTDPGDSASYPSIDTDSNNRPCLSWVSSGASDLIKFARWNGSNWVTVQGANVTASNGLLTPSCTNYQYAPNLKMNSQDNPCIAWQEFDINTYITQIMYGSWNGSAWVNTSGQAYSFDNWNVSHLPGSSYVPSLQIDSMDRPCIAWEYSFNWDYDIYCIRWDGTKWTDASGATYNPGTNGNVSYPSNMSITPDLELDPSGNPCLSWIDNGTGTDQAYFVRWNGTNWTTADGHISDATNPNVSNAPSHIYDPSLAIDSNGNPHMVWSGMANLNPEGPRDIIYVTFEPGRKTLYFGVKVDNPFTNMNFSPICNIATFNHVFDKGVQVVSNSACVVLKSEKVENSNLVVRKVAKSMQYNPTDTFEFKITVTNTGNLEALDVVLVDNFPKEFVFASSLPSGLVGLSGVKFAIGKLAPKASETFSLKFKLSSKITIDDCILATNEAIATSTTQVVKDTAIIRICNPATPDPLSLEIIWQGIDVKTSIGKTSVPVALNIKPHGGTSPYDVTIDWGDGTTTKISSKNKENRLPEVSKQYEKPGEYTVTIKCVDSYGATRIVTRKIRIE
ncbi:MAG: DUF11 domain-containing protein [Caldisericia bacterium]|nr:DUF11 domain-containing protein [Caldisericia bacterium]